MKHMKHFPTLISRYHPQINRSVHQTICHCYPMRMDTPMSLTHRGLTYTTLPNEVFLFQSPFPTPKKNIPSKLQNTTIHML